MRVKSLECENFRNFERLSLDLGERSNRFCGMNAQGKTNLLEAIFLAGCARSHRTGRDRELIRHGAEAYRVRLVYTLDNGSEQELIHLYHETSNEEHLRGLPQRERKILHNGFQLERVADLYGLFQAVIFAPEDLSLVKDGPSVRRRFIDMLVSRLSPSFFKDLQLYQRVMDQRNHLLKQLRGERGSGDALARKMRRVSLEIWDEKLADTGARIIAKRQEYLEKTREAAQTALETISGGGERLDLRYQTASGIESTAPVETIRLQFMKILERFADDDILRGSTSRGPHRDDIELAINGLPVRSFGSQGQQRSLVLALKMAELNVLEEACEEKPVLLLDDVMSELDSGRRRSLLSAVRGHQVFLSCTDFDALDFLGEENEADCASFYVEDGVVRKT